ncbi:MAG: aromatic acid exporter family protein [Clostridium butyricum]|nr:aromatic acid exporter family protein [Clostridium butyricum]
MIKYLQSKSFKMALSATISVLISNYIGLEFGVTSGIISILSIQDTKKESVIVGVKRFFAATIAILLSFLLYVFLGNNPVIFGGFLLIFIPITIKFKIQDGMVVGAVLSTHLLISTNINMHWIINELVLTIIGISIAMMFNLYTASLEDDFEKNKHKIEEQYKLILLNLSESLITQAVPKDEEKIFGFVEKLIYETKIMSQRISNNYFFRNQDYYLCYIDMRMAQFDTLKRMKKHFSRFYMTYEQTKLLSEFTHKVAINIYADNDCIELIRQLTLLREEYRIMELPKNREEFENRALLFQFLNDLEDFLIIKKEFKENF